MKSATVDRDLPGTLVVRVTENSPIAYVQTSGGLRAVDKDGRFLPIDPTRIAIDLPVLVKADTVLLHLLANVRSVSPALFGEISDIRRTGGTDIALTLSTAQVRALASISAQRLADIDKETVDFRPNYDDSEVEPEVLPARIPNLLINGSDGIAVGMATKIPPHNLTEIVDATITLVNNPNAQLAEVLKFVQGPDFPTGGLVMGFDKDREGLVVNNIKHAYATGRGRVLVRARRMADAAGNLHHSEERLGVDPAQAGVAWIRRTSSPATASPRRISAALFAPSQSAGTPAPCRPCISLHWLGTISAKVGRWLLARSRSS